MQGPWFVPSGRGRWWALGIAADAAFAAAALPAEEFSAQQAMAKANRPIAGDRDSLYLLVLSRE